MKTQKDHRIEEPEEEPKKEKPKKRGKPRDNSTLPKKVELNITEVHETA